MGQAFRASPRTIPRVCLLGLADVRSIEKTEGTWARDTRIPGSDGRGGLRDWRDQTLRKLLRPGATFVRITYIHRWVHMYRNNENVCVHFCYSQELPKLPTYLSSLHPILRYTLPYTVPTLDAHVSGGTPLSSMYKCVCTL